MLSDQLGSDTTEAMFKYIDNKTERSVEATIKTLATKDDIANLRKETAGDISNLRKEVSESKVEMIRWMFLFWVGQVAAMLAIFYLKK